MLLIGAIKVFKAINDYMFGEDDKLHSTSADLAMIGLVESVDAFLFALVLIVFANGVYSLFVRRSPIENNQIARWANVSSLGELKNTLAEVIIVILFVQFLRLILIHSNELGWNLLVLPVGILCLAIRLRMMDMLKHSNHDN